MVTEPRRSLSKLRSWLTYAKKEISNTCLEVSGNMSVSKDAGQQVDQDGRERLKLRGVRF